MREECTSLITSLVKIGLQKPLFVNIFAIEVSALPSVIIPDHQGVIFRTLRLDNFEDWTR